MDYEETNSSIKIAIDISNYERRLDVHSKKVK